MAKSEFEILIKKSLFRIAVHLQTALRNAAPVDQGRLWDSIKVKPADDLNGLFISMVDYGRDVEFGTNPHIIKPKNKTVLKFEVGRIARLSGKKKGKTIVFTKEVKHPGTRPNPFIRTTLRTQLGRIIRKEIKRIS